MEGKESHLGRTGLVLERLVAGLMIAGAVLAVLLCLDILIDKFPAIHVHLRRWIGLG